MSQRMEQTMEVEHEEGMDEICAIPSAVSELSLALHMCDDECRKNGFKLIQKAAIVTEKEVQRTRPTCPSRITMKGDRSKVNEN